MNGDDLMHIEMISIASLGLIIMGIVIAWRGFI